MHGSFARAQMSYDAMQHPGCYDPEPEPTPAEVLVARLPAAIAAAKQHVGTIEVDTCDWCVESGSVSLSLGFWEFRTAEELGHAMVAMGSELLKKRGNA